MSHATQMNEKRLTRGLVVSQITLVRVCVGVRVCVCVRERVKSLATPAAPRQDQPRNTRKK